jgi:hypothetical protein
LKTIALIALFVSFSALACPNLTGKYFTCRSETGASTPNSDLEITQKIVAGVTQYWISYIDQETQEPVTDHMIADGKVHTTTERDPESGWVMTNKVKATCVGSQLKVEATMLIDNQNIAQVKILMSKNGTALKQVTNGHFMGETINDTTYCE